MKKRNKLALLVLFLFVKLTVTVAQVDTTFWFAAPWVSQNHAGKLPVALRIATFGNSTTVRVRQPAGTFDTTYVVPANSLATQSLNHHILPTNILENYPANTVFNRGLKITSDFPITVVYDVVTIVNNPETYSIKGQNGLGTEFVCPFQTNGNNGLYNPPPFNPKSQISVVATDYNTVIWVTPKCAVVGHPANITYSVGLGYGQTYNIENVTQATSVPGQNLSGTIITSNKPIAVTVSDDSVAGVSGCFDLMGDQLVPVDVIGKEYIVNKGGMLANQFEGAYIVASENFTQLTIDDGTPTTTASINKGDTYFYKTTQPLTYISATKNVIVLNASGFGCELGEAVLPPLNCAGSNQVAFTRNNTQPFYINVLCKTTAINSFTMNGFTNLVPASAFTLVPGTGGVYSGAQISFPTSTVAVASANLLSNNADVFALGIFHGGASSGCLFHYMSSFLRKTFVTNQTLAPVCVSPGVTIPLTGTVSGGAITGIWSTNGTGTFGAYTSTVNTISTLYTLSNADTLLTSLVFSLTSTGNCTPKTATMSVPIIQRPKVAIGTGSIICKNNVVPIALTGTVTNALGGIWSGATGFFSPGVNISYNPTAADLAAGSLTLTLSSVGGCTTTARSLTVSFVNPPTISAIDNNICTNTQTIGLNASVSGSTLNPTWTTNNGTGLFLPSNQTVTPIYQVSASDYSLTTINFTVTLPPTGPCASVSDVMQLTVHPKPLAISPLTPTSVCSSAAIISLNGSIGGSATSGTWITTNGSGAFSTPPNPIATYTMSQNDTLNGTVTFSLVTDGGIYGCPPDSAKYTVSIIKVPQVLVPNNMAVCENAPVALTGTVIGSNVTGVIWTSTGTGAFTPTNTVLGAQYFPSPGDVATGSVKLTLSSVVSQCPGPPKSFTVTFVKAPKALFTVSSVRCRDSVINFINGSQANGTNGLTYNWNFGDGPPNGTSTSLNPLYTYTNNGSFVITLTVTGTNTLTIPNIQCPDTVSRRITVNPLPIANFSYLNACQGLPAEFRDSSIVIPGNILGWNWNFGDGSSNSPIKNPVHTYTTAGVYNVVLTAISNNSCAAAISKTVTINPQPIAQFGMTNDPTIALEPVYFSDFSAPTGSITTWLWSFGDEGSGTGSSPTHVYQNSGMYVITLTVFDNNGCSDEVSKNIDVQILPQVPTAFTPNKDNNNDLLFVKGGPFEKITFRVYNNWGELLFETNDQKIGWDGTKNGKDQPVGVYVWTLVVDMYNNRQVKKNGDVTIIR
jgi:gliding motility-associated-like protein